MSIAPTQTHRHTNTHKHTHIYISVYIYTPKTNISELARVKERGDRNPKTDLGAISGRHIQQQKNKNKTKII